MLDILTDPALLQFAADPFAGEMAGAVSVQPQVQDVQMRATDNRSLAASCTTTVVAAVTVTLWAVALVPWPLLWLSCPLGWILLALALTDWWHLLLPDALPLSLGLTDFGLTALWYSSLQADNASDAVLGCCVFTAFAAVYWCLRRRDGLDDGDAKVLAASGAWLGWQGLPSVVAISALTGLAAAGVGRVAGRQMSSLDAVSLDSHLALADWLGGLCGPILVV